MILVLYESMRPVIDRINAEHVASSALFPSPNIDDSMKHERLCWQKPLSTRHTTLSKRNKSLCLGFMIRVRPLKSHRLAGHVVQPPCQRCFSKGLRLGALAVYVSAMFCALPKDRDPWHISTYNLTIPIPRSQCMQADSRFGPFRIEQRQDTDEAMISDLSAPCV